MKISSLAIALLLSVDTAAAAKPKPPPKKADPIAAAHARVSDQMRDPETARFSDSFVSSSGSVCGMVNGKNAMGGYSGKTRFIVTLDRVMIEDNAGSAAFDYRWSELCTDDLAVN